MSVAIPNSVTSIGASAFSGCSVLMNVNIPNSVTSIGAYAFMNSGLSNVNIPNSVTKIDKCVLQSCDQLWSVTISNSVTSIGESAFNGCSKLTSVAIPNSVTSIDKYAFDYCSGLTELYSLNPTPPTIDDSNFTKEQYRKVHVYVPQGSLSAYKSADTWKNFKNLQEFDPTGVETIKADMEKVDDTYYDIQGRKLNAPKNGLNIINGKKVLIRK